MSERSPTKWLAAVSVIALVLSAGTLGYAYTETTSASNSLNMVSAQLSALEGVVSNAYGVNLTVLEGAIEEGSLTWYTGAPLTQAQPIANAFEQAYPFITVNIVAGPGPATYAKLLSEQASGVYRADVIWFDDLPMMTTNANNGLFMKYTPPGAQFIANNTKDPGYLYPIYFYTVATEYNTHTIPKNDTSLLQSYSGILQLEKMGFKNCITVPSSGFTYYYWWNVLMNNQSLGPSFATAMKQDTNNLAITTSGTTCANGVGLGVYDFTPMGLDAASYAPFASGQPVGWVYPNPALVLPMENGILAHAPHPYAAILFEDWLLSANGLRIVDQQTGSYSPRSDLSTSPTTLLSQSWYSPPKTVFVVPASADAPATVNATIKEWTSIFG